MNRRLLPSFALSCVLLFAIAGSTLAQSLRPERTFFLTPRVGVSHYWGDNLDITTGSQFSWAGGIEVGYQTTTRFSVSGSYIVADYPRIAPPGWDYTMRHTAQLLLRWTARAAESRVAPYAHTGLHGTVGGRFPDQIGGIMEDRLAIGPLLGVGLDFALGPQTSLFVDITSNLTRPDEAVDGNPGLHAGANSGQTFDLLTWGTLGLKYSLRSAVVPAPLIISITGPTTLQVNESGTWTVNIQEGAAPPIEYRWSMGDGTTATGPVVTHAYRAPGTYTISATATGPGGSDTATRQVTVTAAPAGPEIVSMTANPPNPVTGQPVTFTGTVRGDQPITCRWDFGDGNTATGCTATHTYAQPGTYNVTLTATNPVGSDTRTMSLPVGRPPIQLPDVAELNVVCFAPNSAALDATGRARLMENVEVLRRFPEACVRVDAYAERTEANPQRLSEQRAQAVEQFYIQQGIAPARILARGLGVWPEPPIKEDPGRGRCAHSIPMACEDLARFR